MEVGLEPVPITAQKHDPAWKHCLMFKDGDRVQLKCVYCGKIFKGGGIHRIKEHLAGQKGNASTCLQTPPDVRLLMQQSLDGVVVKKKKKQKIAEEITNINAITTANEIDSFTNQCDTNSGILLIPGPDAVEPGPSSLVTREEGNGKNGDRRKRVRGKSSTVNTEFLVTGNGMELAPKKVNNQIHIAIGRFLYDIGAPLDAVKSAYFQPMIDAIASAGSGVLGPSYHDIRGGTLKNLVDEVKNDIDKHKVTWGKTGCSVLLDQRITEMGRTFLSVLVYCPDGVVFLKSIDASDIINSSEALYELLKQVVEEIGERHVIQIITRGEEPYVSAGRRLTDTFPTLYWAPCALQCIDLILQDFGKVGWINAVVHQVRSITRFIYNHSTVLNMMRRYTYGNDIVDPAPSCSATDFKTLRRIFDFKHHLQAMVTSQEWVDCEYSKKAEGLEMLDLLNNDSFWSSCTLITHLTMPFLRLLKIVSNEKRPAMGYVYAGMYRAKEAIKRELVKREDYMVYWNMIDHRWEQQQHLPLHAAGFYLNPKFSYSVEGDMRNEIKSRMFDCIERLVPDTKVQDKIMKELNAYHDALGDFGRKMAIRARDTFLPVEWWSAYGGSCPNLARLAIRILSQTCSSVVCKQSQIPFEQIHNVKNCLERQRLSDLLFVHYNLQLKQRGSKSNEPDCMDPLSVDYLNAVEDWVSNKETSYEEYGSSRWATLDPPCSSTVLSGCPNDEAEDLGAGFDDYEVFNREREGEEVIVEENVRSQ